MENFIHGLSEFLRAVFPEGCPVCGVGQRLPGPCPRHEMRLESGVARCPRCASRSVQGLPQGFRCGQCARRRLGLRRVLVLGDYHAGAPLRDWVLSLKHGGRRGLAQPLGLELGRLWLREASGGGEPLLVPVPLHRTRCRERGYDQALLLAQSAGMACNGQVQQLLCRPRWTHPQGAGVRSRRANVAGAFRLRRPSWVPGGPEPLGDRNVWLVDDVLTSGATLQACARVLRQAGARQIGALVVARAARVEVELE
jgi:predicted amidophosphoribosyltransferase